MEQVVLKALTIAGEKALRMMHGRKDIPLKDRFLYKSLYDELVISEEPFSYSIKPRGAIRKIALHVRPEDFVNELVTHLKSLEVINNIDYIIEAR